MDAKLVDQAVAAAKADVAKKQAEGMVIDAWGVVAAVLARLSMPALAPAPVVAPPAPTPAAPTVPAAPAVAG